VGRGRRVMISDTRPSLPLRSGHGSTSLFLNRCAVDWRDKPPSRTAYEDWLADSLPVNAPEDTTRDASADEVQLPAEPELELTEAAE
jgi:hypothetical protein